MRGNRSFREFSAFVLPVLLGACATWSYDENVPVFDQYDHPSPTAADSVTCGAMGGRWKGVGFYRTPTCVFSTSDAGKTCTSSSECQSRCVVPDADPANKRIRPYSRVRGVCDDEYETVGRCIQRVHEGIASATLCTD
jgi:hypothetical protein